MIIRSNDWKEIIDFIDKWVDNYESGRRKHKK